MCSYKYIIFVYICVSVVILCDTYEKTWNTKYDYIIVGAGTAGCVLANRLSEDPNVTVLLLEAGPDASEDPFVSVPRSWLNVATNHDYGWGYMSESQRFLHGQKLPLYQGKMLGGSSSQNPMLVSRGSPHDYDRWEQLGNKGWSYKHVLPFFKKSESVLDPILAADSEYRGKKGPWNIRSSYKFPMGDTFMKGMTSMGYEETHDYNGEYQKDFGFVQMNVDDHGHRSGAYEAYLKPVLDRRQNLHVLTNAVVLKIKTKKYKYLKAIGVQLKKDRKTNFIRALKEVIVSAGAINTPKLLMLSGIGPRRHLSGLGIPVVANLPVGNGLLDHVRLHPLLYSTNKTTTKAFSFESVLEYLFSGTGPWSSIGGQMFGFFRSSTQPAHLKFPFIQLLLGERISHLPHHIAVSLSHQIPINTQLYESLKSSESEKALLSLHPILLHPRTSGTIRLRSKDPFQSPRITLNFLRNKNDIQDMIEAIRLIQSLAQTKAFEDIEAMPLFEPNQNCTGFRYDTDEYWECHIRHNVESFSQFTSSCRMAPGDPGPAGVVDNRLRVYGIKNLRVVDSSVFPDAISGNPMAAVIMVAEKASDIIKKDNDPDNK